MSLQSLFVEEQHTSTSYIIWQQASGTSDTKQPEPGRKDGEMAFAQEFNQSA